LRADLRADSALQRQSRVGGIAELVPSGDRFLARLTASALQAGHDARWDYTFEEISLQGDGTVAVIAAGRTGTAINLDELAHIAEPSSGTAWYVWGVNAHSGTYPAGFRPRPVAGGGTSGTHKVNAIVEITARIGPDGEQFYTLSGQGSHDGSCDL
jgi:hypothetical protein